jgi:hypothetical protein
MDALFAWVSTNWTSVVALLWTIDQLLKIISPLTPFKVDDNLSDILGGLLAKFFPKGLK